MRSKWPTRANRKPIPGRQAPAARERICSYSRRRPGGALATGGAARLNDSPVATRERFVLRRSAPLREAVLA